MTLGFDVNDEGKPVVTADGERVGTVHRASDDHIHLLPADGIARRVQRRLGWSGDESQVCELDRTVVASKTDDEIRLRRLERVTRRE